MLNQLSTIDLVVMGLMLLIMPTAGILVALRRKNAEQYFLAGRSIRWWTVAGSVFGSNISSFHLIGMLGVGYSIGFVQAHYEIVFPAVLLLGYVFLASYRKLGLFTLSQYCTPFLHYTIGTDYPGTTRRRVLCRKYHPAMAVWRHIVRHILPNRAPAYRPDYV